MYPKYCQKQVNKSLVVEQNRSNSRLSGELSNIDRNAKPEFTSYLRKFTSCIKMDKHSDHQYIIRP